MTVVHIVLFEWKSTARPAQIEEACNRMLALKGNCVGAASGDPYIRSLSGGKNNSTEGLASPFTHGFIVEFDSVQDRDYYVDQDPAHQDFKQSVGELIESAKVLDYEPGRL